jgi:hypothetical protein
LHGINVGFRIIKINQDNVFLNLDGNIFDAIYFFQGRPYPGGGAASGNTGYGKLDGLLGGRYASAHEKHQQGKGKYLFVH